MPLIVEQIHTTTQEQAAQGRTSSNINVLPIIPDQHTGIIHTRHHGKSSLVIKLDGSDILASLETRHGSDPEIIEQRKVFVPQGAKRVNFDVPELNASYTISN